MKRRKMRACSRRSNGSGSPTTATATAAAAKPTHFSQDFWSLMSEVLGPELFRDRPFFHRMVATRCGIGEPNDFPPDAVERRWHVAMFAHVAGKFHGPTPDGPSLGKMIYHIARAKGMLDEDQDLWDRAIQIGKDNPFSADDLLRMKLKAAIEREQEGKGKGKPS